MTEETKKIIFFYSFKDSGHQHAAKAIKQSLCELEPSIQTLDVEAISLASPLLGKFIHKAYLGMIKKTNKIYDYLWDNQRVYKAAKRAKIIIDTLKQKRFIKLFNEFKPQLVICTQAFPCGIISKLKEKYHTSFKIIAVITDYDVHSYWIYDNVDCYMVATGVIKKKLIDRGISEEKIMITGIPVSSKFEKSEDKIKLVEKFNLAGGKPIILIMGGSLGLGPILKIVSELDKIDEEFQMVAVTGKNKKIEKKLKYISSKLKKTLKVYGYIDNVNELMSVASLLITKPGGITITEALTKKLPMVMYNTVGGQETKNYKFLIDKKVVLESKNLHDLKSIVSSLLKNPQKLYNSKYIDSFIKPHVSLTIAEILLRGKL